MRPDRYEPLFRRSLAIRERVLGVDNIATADSLHALGVVLHDEGRAAEALPFLARAFEIRLRELKQGDLDRVEVTRDYVGACYVRWAGAPKRTRSRPAGMVQARCLGEDQFSACAVRSGKLGSDRPVSDNDDVRFRLIVAQRTTASEVGLNATRRVIRGAPRVRSGR